MNLLDSARRAQVLSCLVEGNSIRATVRMTGVAKNTVTRLLLHAGIACAEFQDKVVNSLESTRIQADEIWSFCYAKDKNLPEERRGEFGVGSVWTWTAMDADTKLMVSWAVGNRDAETAYLFMQDVAGRLKNRVQLTTDGHGAYLQAVDEAFGGDIDYAMLIKVYGKSEEDEKRYSPAKCVGCETKVIAGKPDKKHINTSYVERQNLTMRMHMRRFTRLTNAFSKKIENHIAAISLHFFYYNFVRIHQTLRITPAMAAGVALGPLELSDIVKLVEQYEATHKDAVKAKVKEGKERQYNPFGPALGHS